jgi:tRNA(Ile)-lysidine synthase
MRQSGARWCVAVSGGADSVCLLHVLHVLRERLDLQLQVLHVNHGQRGEAAEADAAFVEQLAEQLALPYRQENLQLGELSNNREARLREARHACFREVLQRKDADAIVTAHTLSDQAETLLFRLLRGSGVRGLAAMQSVADGPLLKPMLGIHREEARNWLRAQTLPWREDESNKDLRMARNRIRRVLLPALERDWNPALSATLGRTADILSEEDQWMVQETARVAAPHLRERFGGVLVPASWLADLPRALARRVVRMVSSRLGGLHDLEFQHVENALALAADAEGTGRFQAPEIDVTRSFDWLWFCRPGNSGDLEERSLSLPIRLGSTLALRGANIRVSLGSYNEGWVLDPARLEQAGIAGHSLTLRYWQPGDRYQRVGAERVETLKELFQSQRVPLWDRRFWPIVTGGGEILWTGFGYSAAYAAQSLQTAGITIISEEC